MDELFVEAVLYSMGISNPKGYQEVLNTLWESAPSELEPILLDLEALKYKGAMDYLLALLEGSTIDEAVFGKHLMNIEFEQLNKEWNAEPNAPEVSISVSGNNVEVTFFLNAFQFENFNEQDTAKLVFHDCLQYRYGSPNDEGFYIFNQSRFKKLGIKWGEFYLVHNSDWEDVFPDCVHVSDQQHDGLKHYLFYFRDGTFECIARDYDLFF